MKTTYREILEEVLPFYRQDPERFMNFYHRVNNIVASIPEGESIRINDFCKPASRNLFIKVASMYMMEEASRKESALDSYLEFIDDYNVIRHVAKMIPTTPWNHFYSNRR